MRITWTQFAEAARRDEPGIPVEDVRARYAALASQDGDLSDISDEDQFMAAGGPRVTKKPLPDQFSPYVSSPTRPQSLGGVNVAAACSAVRLVEREQRTLSALIEDPALTIRVLLSYAAGQPARLRLLQRSELVGLVTRLRTEAPQDGFRMATILADAVIAAARDPRLTPREKEMVIADSCEALLQLKPADVKYALHRYAPRMAEYLNAQDLARANQVVAQVPTSMFGKNAG